MHEPIYILFGEWPPSVPCTKYVSELLQQGDNISNDNNDANPSLTLRPE